MKEYLRQEIEVWDIIPAIRRDLAKIMIEDYHLTQRDAASRLKLTEAAVSQYVSSKRAKGIAFSEKTIAEMKKSVQRIIAGADSLMPEMQRICELPEIREMVCTMHKGRSNVPKDCRVCR